MIKTKFEELGLKDSILKSINDLNFENPSDIQEKSIPVSLQGYDIIGQAQTGTGKTLAFGAPILSNMGPKGGAIQTLILAPTRELAIQVSEELLKLCKYEKYKILPIYGGQSFDRQLAALKRGVDIVVGTPGRILDHINRRTLKLQNVKFLVLDEADEMLNMGFIEDIESILSNLNEERQTLLFSATMPRPIKNLSKNYMKPDAQHIVIAKKSMTVSKIQQSYFLVNSSNKFDSLCRILDVDNPTTTIMFCKTKKGVDELVDALHGKGYSVEGMHGDMKQSQRMNTLAKFKSGQLHFLVATDVAARGIDVEDVTHVINYDLPQDIESYVHRIGRTGRANKEGIAYSFASRKEVSFIRQIENHTKSKIVKKDIPTLADIFSAKSGSLIENIGNVLQEDSYNTFLPMAKELINEYGAEDVTASLLKLMFDKELNCNYAEESVDVDDTTRLFLSIGKLDKARAKDVIEFLDNTAGVKGKEIGRIDILDKFSFVDVPSNLVNIILENSKGKMFGKRKVNIEISNKRK
ncbi:MULTISPECIES: DEAD/DEAH box helicase [Clostridium]|uniref:ATP-dependent RNA helicase CshA n=1 Tax=Clostridium sulfidigenes TaxID=318464 RepID=A0A084JB16_9CLOT|nr:DEAD/DEAH box helicase [Clostridium sulfidigenes]HAR84327.1 DEAD/DEAH box helicase [Clostridium sp.]KEZ86150.1 DEAD/DEAH box helicase [Clostridium sulfidigenes]MBE6061109.1 DEAD/DEAH box helicase [Clostridium sulfidigenes]HBA04491.1 DEAD/DEAH box helicase [Clostridium sp.]HCO74129.1 DEAD/DEAH box helicase [Clostridium sp.]